MPVLLHRDRELAAANLVMGRLSGGSPAVMMIEGGRGAGKSALLQAVLMLGPEPAVTLRARCHAAEHDFAFGVVRQLFEPVADSGPGAGWRRARCPARLLPAHPDDRDQAAGDHRHRRSPARRQPVRPVVLVPGTAARRPPGRAGAGRQPRRQPRRRPGQGTAGRAVGAHVHRTAPGRRARRGGHRRADGRRPRAAARSRVRRPLRGAGPRQPADPEGDRRPPDGGRADSVGGQPGRGRGRGRNPGRRGA